MFEKVLLIVGAGPGISLTAAKKFGEKGFKIALISRSNQSLQEYVNELKNHGITAQGFPGDASSEESLKAAIKQVLTTFGNVDVLLYNAAAGQPGVPTTLSTNQLIEDFKVSVAGALTSVKEVLPLMESGAIILTGGGLALEPYAGYASLAIGKAGIRNLAYSLHQELQPKSIYVGTLTIKGFVKEGTYFSPENIAQAFYEMYEKQDQVEVVYEEK
ncbi:SDR family NAD(P)-dependent oxidoreductase [Priestia flexa]|uniref:SDR family NAD(P)-dependent oxidoreductase n=1 Tax=Priestia flexa TaxID=86664 RepID=UPI00288FBED9|nr:SDR family NAD(P)-dependent oxidoreductase [Priestia flexa]MDT2046811.1 SDR family NAD(P)-dependent oxidoreductase [Priestia flexa]